MGKFLDFLFGYEEIKIEDKYAYLKDSEKIAPADYYNAYLYNYIINAKLSLNEKIDNLSSEIGYWRASAVNKFDKLPDEEFVFLYVPDVPKGAYDLDKLFENTIDRYYMNSDEESYYSALQKHALTLLNGITYENSHNFHSLVKKEEEIDFAIAQHDKLYYSDD